MQNSKPIHVRVCRNEDSYRNQWISSWGGEETRHIPESHLQSCEAAIPKAALSQSLQLSERKFPIISYTNTRKNAKNYADWIAREQHNNKYFFTNLILWEESHAQQCSPAPKTSLNSVIKISNKPKKGKKKIRILQ